MASRCGISASRVSAVTANCASVQFLDRLKQLLTGSSATRHLSSSVVPLAERQSTTEITREENWFELPPVPKAMPVPVRTSREQNYHNGLQAKSQSSTVEETAEYQVDFQMQQLTALRWVAKSCPSVPNSLVQKLFRLRQIRQRAPASLDYSESPESDSDVSGKTILEEGTLLYIPRSVFQLENADNINHQKQNSKYQPSPAEMSWLQSHVLHKDSQILVINKPPGLPVQGGSNVKKSLDSLMGASLRYDYSEGPRLVHRLDKDTSGCMVLARTKQSAVFLHALFRNKTSAASAPSAEDDIVTASRSYLALVIGTPSKAQGRISRPLIKMVVDNSRGEQIMVADDETSEGAQVAVTDFKVVGPSNYGCTWLELRPLTGRKHQLRVHCAEVLGTPIVGDYRYGWKSHRTWKEHLLLQNPETWALAESFIEEGLNNLEALVNLKKVHGSVLSKDLMLHLHCQELTLPDAAKLLDISSSKIDRRALARVLRFVSPIPPHMAVSKKLLQVV
ncbi:hypothetical protein R1sor_010835 [Riccia sorocarpa]|uniref:Pseudouridine synthase RsuA/RluA-like domain-containing protein n=1 Tax=Riccia sorocarpa TaxID=122646 RepID=A0ABD3I116_9MARC